MPDQDPLSVKLSLAATNAAMQKVRLMHLTPPYRSLPPTHFYIHRPKQAALITRYFGSLSYPLENMSIR